MSALGTGTRRRRSLASPKVLGLAGLAVAALAIGGLALAGPAPRGSEASAGGAGQLAWKAPPRVYVAPGDRRDRILTGIVRNDTLRIAEVEARDIRVVGEGGERLKSAGIFLASFSRGLYAAPRKDQATDIEQRRTGRLLRIGPGDEAPLTVSWRLGSGEDRAERVEYGDGSLEVPR